VELNGCGADSKKHSESVSNSANLPEPPPKDDAISPLLFQLLQTPRIEGCDCMGLFL
jgi:hypothetical protein